MKTWTAIAVLGLWGALPLGESSRAEPPPPAAPAEAAPGVREAAPPASGPLQLRMKEVEIRGDVERPEVFYIIPRKEARMELGPLSRDFREEIMEPLLPGPFEESVRKSAGKRAR